MSAAALKALLTAEKSNSLGGQMASDLVSERSKAMDYYNGDLSTDMPVGEGRSKAISSDVSDTIDGLLPSLMDIFASGDEVVRFEPVGPEDEQAAQQETDYVNHVFMQKNPGFVVLHNFIKDALLSKNGIVKVFWDDDDSQQRETYVDQPDDAFVMMASDPDAEIAEHTEHKDEKTGEVTHDVTIVRKKSYGCARVVGVPPEEFGITKRARSILDATYCFHNVRTLTEADLIAQGFDEDQVKTLPTLSVQEGQEQLSRDTLHEEQGISGDTINRSARIIDVTEHYVKMDYEGDGKPQLYRVTTGGNQLEVLLRDGKEDVIPVDVMPFAAMTPVIVTHRFFGRSIADLVMDIMRIKTALIRGQLDNIYGLNNNRYEVAETGSHERTLDDLLVNRPGGIIRVKTTGTVVPIVNQPIGNVIFPMLEYMDNMREFRSGVTRQGQGVDANALQNQSATAVAQAFSAAQAKMKLIARIFAETGIRDMFSLLHGTIRKNEKKASIVRLNNKWVPVDPRNWKTRDDMTVNVGLGTGSRDQEVAHLMLVLNAQKELQLSPDPAMRAIASPLNIYNTLSKLVERIGLKTAQPYFTDPKEMPPQAQQQPPPDPNMIKAQGQLQLQAQKMQGDATMQQQKLQTEAQLKVRQQDLEAELERERQAKDAQVAVATAAINGHVKMNTTPPVQFGGRTG
jgi:hypothetical protein